MNTTNPCEGYLEVSIPQLRSLQIIYNISQDITIEDIVENYANPELEEGYK